MKVVFLLSLFILISCNKEAEKVAPSSSKVQYDFNQKGNSLSVKDDFSDLKKLDDESCETEEEIQEKLVKPKQEAFKLQGGDTGCDISELNKEE